MPYKPKKPGAGRPGPKSRPGGKPGDRQGGPGRNRGDDRGDRPYRKRDDSREGQGAPDRYRDRPDRPQRPDRDDRPGRDRDERPGRSREDRPRHGDRGDRPGYGNRGDRPGYGNRGDRPGYGDRGDRPRYGDRGDRPQRGGSSDRPYRDDRGPRRDDRGPRRDDRGPRRYERGSRDDSRAPYRGGPGRDDQANRGDYARRSAPKNQLPEALIYGINPVSVALDRGRLRKLFIDPDSSNPRLLDIQESAESSGIEILSLEGQGWGEALSRDMHQGVAGLLSGRQFKNLEELVIGLEDEDESTVLFLDKIQDPHNLGAVLRTAAATGVDAVVLPKSGACGLTPAVHKASAGMSLVVNVIEDVNFAQALAMLKQHGYWVVGCDSGGGEDATVFEYPKRRVLVMGSEGSGIRRLVRESCDHLVRLPMAAGVESLNISVATGVILYTAQASALRGVHEETHGSRKPEGKPAGLSVDPAIIGVDPEELEAKMSPPEVEATQSAPPPEEQAPED